MRSWIAVTSRRTGARSGYFLGRSAVLLGQSASRGLGLHLAQPVLDSLREETGETVNLGSREGAEMVIVIRSESHHPLRFSQVPGSRLPLHATSMGKATLAYCADVQSEVDSLPHPLVRLTGRTITEQATLLAELRTIRNRGFSVDDEEAIPGVRCVAAPILSPSGRPVAAVAIQGPAVRMSRSRLKELSGMVCETARAITRLLPLSHYD